MKVYISGAISGLLPEEYHRLFEKGANAVRAKGWTPVNPLEVGACDLISCGDGTTKPDGSQLHAYGCYMKYDIKAMLDCDAIVMLPNWPYSNGAEFERNVARMCGLLVLYFDDNIEEVI